MIVRKPYAFLIKNFKKVHIFLLIISLYIYFKNTQTYSFVKEFISLGSYDYYNEPITKYIGFLVIFSLLVLIGLSTSIILLLRKKEKPWKLYLLPLVQYLLLFIAYTIIRSYFNTYTGVESTASLRAWRDILLISQFIQFGVFIIFMIRIFGIDLNKFNFKLDEEYLELEQSDRDELEININIDKSTFKRLYRKTLRNLNYFYQEHKLICRILIFIFILILGKSTIDYISNHRSYKQGDTFNVNGYTVTINNSYYSDKSYNGKEISKSSAFVVIDITILNNGREREVDLNKYHVINGVSNYTTTSKTYETEFQDLGKTYEIVNLKNGDKVNMIMIFKVDKKLKKNRFVLYYQELANNTKNMRKIKLKINDLSKIQEKASLKLGDTMSINIKNQEEDITFEEFQILPRVNYVYRICVTTNCNNSRSIYTAPTNYKIMELSFGSDTYEGKDMSDFASKYGTIQYVDTSGKTKQIDIENPINRTYYGKYLYIKVPNELTQSESIILNFTIRDNKYVYKIK